MDTFLILNQYRRISSYKDVVGKLYHFPKRCLKKPMGPSITTTAVVRSDLSGYDCLLACSLFSVPHSSRLWAPFQNPSAFNVAQMVDSES